MNIFEIPVNCPKCGGQRELYTNPNSGYTYAICKPCRKKRILEWRKTHYGRSITKVRECRAKNKNKYKESAKQYYHNNKQQILLKDKIRYHKNKKRNRARYLLRWAIIKGNIIRKPCQICGNLDSEGHHPNYDKPLEVIWLCKSHHRQLHCYPELKMTIEQQYGK